MKTKRHLLLALKKKSGVALTEVEAKELKDLETAAATATKSDEDKKKEEADKAAADAKAKEDADKAEADKKAKEEADVAAKKKEGEGGTVTLESVAAQVSEIVQNMNTMMEALSQLLEVSADAPAKEEKPAEEEKTPGEEEKPADEEEEMTEDEMMKELEKTIDELESLDA